MGRERSEAQSYLANAASLVEAELRRAFRTCRDVPEKLRAAMEHSLFAGGKRLRPALCLAAAEAVGGRREDALPGACALEMVHTYSLIHDDLPAMDDDALRRGRPTCHVAFGEAAAILAGDALLTEAFATLAASPADPGRVRRAVAILANAAGAQGMVGGQQLDLDGEGRPATAEAALAIHLRKTAALIQAAVLVGAVLAGSSGYEQQALGRYGQALGLAFQVADDVLDATSSVAELGKSPGKDRDQQKLTYVAAVGVTAARRQARRLAREAAAALEPFRRRPVWTVLRGMADLAAERKK